MIALVLALAIQSASAAPAIAATPATKPKTERRDATGATAPDPSKAPAVAPNLPMTTPNTPTSSAKDEGPLAQLGDGVAPPSTEATDWKAIPENTRYLLIMGTTDGFAAAGSRAPCFPDQSSGQIDKALTASGFSTKRPGELPEGLKAIAAKSEACKDLPGRSYDTGFLRKLSDEELATYLTAMVRGYSRITPCEPQGQSAGALMSARLIMGSDEGTPPIPVLRKAMADGCEQGRAH